MSAKQRKRKIAVICASRATYGYKRRIIQLLKKSKGVELQTIVTGMHLMKSYGYSVTDLKRDGIPITAQVPMSEQIDTPYLWAKALGKEMQDLAKVYKKLHPDLIMISGDRAEMFVAATAAAYMNIPVAHIQAGDVSGHVDGIVRHAITKLSHLHFASCRDSYLRVKRLGEESWRIFNTGAPQLDDVIRAPRKTRDELEHMFGFDFKKPVAIVVQHAILSEAEDAGRQMRETMEAIRQVGLQTVVVYPNSDAGGRKIIKVIKSYEHLDFIKCFRNLDRQTFISLMAHSAVLVGNSSSGILEAPSFKLATVNIGDRQRGRIQAKNIINVGYDRKDIGKAIGKALHDKRFKRILRKCRNPYGDGHSSERIVTLLRKTPIDKKLLDKAITY